MVWEHRGGGDIFWPEGLGKHLTWHCRKDGILLESWEARVDSVEKGQQVRQGEGRCEGITVGGMLGREATAGVGILNKNDGEPLKVSEERSKVSAGKENSIASPCWYSHKYL